MSLINQVLIDLEKRGASTRIGEATVHVVPLRQGHGKLWLLVAAISVPVLAATVWLKWDGEIRINAPLAQQIAVPASVMQPAVISAPAASNEAAGTSAGKMTVVPAEPASPISTAVMPVAATAAKPLAVPLPVITEVSPNPAISLGVKQAVTIGGKNFATDATVVLRMPDGKVFPRRHIVLQDQTQIVISANFSDIAGAWSVEVENAGGQTSNPYTFMVQSTPAPAKIRTGKKSGTQTKTDKKADKAATAEASAVAVNPVVIRPAIGISKQPSQTTPQQQAENEFRKAYELMQQGRTSAAISGYEAVIKLDAGHAAARQALVRLLLENKRNAEAEHLLVEGLQHDPKQSGMAMLLARMQVGRNELGEALETMQKSLPYAGKQADYQAFVAALLQRQNKHKEAITYFQNAVQLNPQSGVWQMGLGISLRAEERKEEAREAFNRALETHSLNAELSGYVTQQLKEL